jgi:general stress protein 26
MLMNLLHKTHPVESSASIESKRRIRDFLTLHPVGVLATIDPNDNPHASVIYFSVDDDFNILFTTKHDTKKHDSLKHHNHAMLVTFEAESQSTVQITGVAEEITDSRDANEAFKGTLKASLQTSEAGIAPISKLYAGQYVAYRLKPKQIRMAIFSRPVGSGREIFETLDF